MGEERGAKIRFRLSCPEDAVAWFTFFSMVRFAVFWTRFPVSPAETLVQESMLTQVWAFLVILLLDAPLCKEGFVPPCAVFRAVLFPVVDFCFSPSQSTVRENDMFSLCHSSNDGTPHGKPPGQPCSSRSG